MPIPPAPPAAQGVVRFGASWSRSTRFLTLGVLLSCAAILGITYSGSRQSVVFYLTAACVGGAIGAAYWYAPIGYEVDEMSGAHPAARRTSGHSARFFARRPADGTRRTGREHLALAGGGRLVRLLRHL